MNNKIALCLASAILLCGPNDRALGIDGAGVETIIPIDLGTAGPIDDWKSFEVITEGASLNGLNVGDGYVPGATTSSGTFSWTNGIHDHWDGIGTYQTSANNLRILLNHEGTSDATITAVDVNVGNLIDWVDQTTGTTYAGPGQVVIGIGNAFSAIDVTTGGSGRNMASTPLSRLCSGTLYDANSFGGGLGFANRMYLTGEEVSGGRFFAMDTNTNTLYEAPDLGIGSWENAALINTGRTDTVALLLSNDAGQSATGTGTMRLYVGEKGDIDGSGSIDFLEANGLKGGQVYYWDPDGDSTNATTNTGLFSGLGNGDSVSGVWTLDPLNAALFSKAEDVHTNPDNGRLVALGSQGEGVYQFDFGATDFVLGNLGANKSTDVTVLFNSNNDGGTLNNVDNLVWSSDGSIYINEDGDGQDVFSLDPSDGSYLRILDGLGTETSGITDISALIGFQPGSIFLTNSYDGDVSNGGNGSLHLLVAPTAAVAIPEPSTVALLVLSGALIVPRLRRR